ncbi:MAG: hypothetical protein ACFFBR_11535 [Promethearchaeota archaeon]
MSRMIKRPIKKRVDGPTGLVAEAEDKEPKDGYLSKIVKHIPAEIVAAFVTINGILLTFPALPVTIHWIVFAVLLIFTPLYFIRFGLTDLKKDAERYEKPVKEYVKENRYQIYPQVILSPVAFITWVFALGGPFLFFPWYQPVLGAILLALITIIIPWVDWFIIWTFEWEKEAPG